MRRGDTDAGTGHLAPLTWNAQPGRRLSARNYAGRDERPVPEDFVIGHAGKRSIFGHIR